MLLVYLLVILKYNQADFCLPSKHEKKKKRFAKIKIQEF